MNADVLYAILMSVGWLFLVGWLALLLVACGLVFRSDGWNPSPVEQSFLIRNADRAAGDAGGTRWNIGLRG